MNGNPAMKKLLLICLLLSAVGCSHTWQVNRRATGVGKTLCATTASGRSDTLGGSRSIPDVAVVDPDLAEKLRTLSGDLARGYSVKRHVGDVPPPVGDGRATHHLIIHTHSGDALGIRLRYDAAGDVFHVLGHWTP